VKTERESVSSAHKLDGLGKLKEHAPRSEHVHLTCDGSLHTAAEKTADNSGLPMPEFTELVTISLSGISNTVNLSCCGFSRSAI
jgi:hypothetical protein